MFRGYRKDESVLRSLQFASLFFFNFILSFHGAGASLGDHSRLPVKYVLRRIDARARQRMENDVYYFV